MKTKFHSSNAASDATRNFTQGPEARAQSGYFEVSYTTINGIYETVSFANVFQKQLFVSAVKDHVTPGSLSVHYVRFGEVRS